MSSVHDLGVQDHVCWTHDGDDEFRDRALDFLAEGIALGQQVMYVGPGCVEELAEVLRPLGGDRLVQGGAARVLSLPDVYGSGTPVSPEAQLAGYVQASDAAIAAGYHGLRVAAEATSLVVDDDRRDAFLRYEHLIDRAMCHRPIAAMCGYDRTVLGDAVAAELACMHPVAVEGVTPFRIFARPGFDLAIGGDLDAPQTPAFRLALERAVSVIDRESLVVDARDLAFIDHNGLLALEQLGHPILLEGAPHSAGRLAGLLGLRNVAVVHSS